jgi:DNA-binding CsgD family transcriptional regulator
LSLLAQALALRAWSAIYIGSFEVARSADEAIRLADETSQPVWGATARIAAALLAGLRGDQSVDLLLDEAGRVASGSRLPMSSLLAGIQLARGVTDLGAGRYESAYGNLRRMFDPREPCFHEVQRFWSLSYLAEAAAHSGRRREGRMLLADLERLIGDLPCPAAEIAMFFANTVLAEDDKAESWYEAALIGPGSELPWHRARVQLNYGSWLRRHRRTRDSRAHLRAARQTFESLGATAFAHRADTELRATGEKGWAPAVNAWDLLSPQESQIAQLAAQGLSNKEISERLFLSHRTVGSHLYRMFPKLGVTSRAQLASALLASPEGTAAEQD